MRALLVLLACLAAMACVAGAHAAPTEGPGREHSVVILNRAGKPIVAFYASRASEPGWGDDMLGDQPIAPGRSIPMRLGRGRDCLFDLQVVYADGSVEERHGVDVCRVPKVAFDASTATAPEPEAPRRQVSIVNRSPRPIDQIFISAPNSDDWGPDRLGDSMVRPGSQADIAFNGGCVNDLRVTFENKSAEERRNLDFCKRASVVIRPGWTTADDSGEIDQVVAPAPLPDVGIVNHSGHTMTEVYLAPEGAPDEGHDLLGRNVLEDGARTTVPFDRGAACRIAVHAVFQGKAEDDRRVVDLCRTRDVVIAP